MFNLSIVTPEKIFYENEVASLIAPGIEGYLGVLTDHAPLITAVTPGKVIIKDGAQQETVLSVSDGFLEVSSNTATLLVDAVEYASEIDAERAKEALKRKAMERAKSRIRIASGD